MRRLLALGLLALVAACGDAPVVVGSKEPAQDRILGEMFALLLEDAGVRVERRIGLGDSAANFEAIRSGAIDLYPEYTGTALTLIGEPPTRDEETDLARIREAYAPLGLTFLEPLGFESSYAVVTRPELAARDDLETVEDLRRVARRLTLGVTTSFAERPADGLDAALDRYGLNFRDVRIVPGSARVPLYDALVTGEIDVMVGFSTDPEIEDFALTTLGFDAPLLPSYEAVALVAEAALAREPRIRDALGARAVRRDSDRIRTLTRQVEIAGRTPRAAAAYALAELDLIERTLAEPNVALMIALDADEIGRATANRVLRAVRIAMPGRNVGFVESARPLSEIFARNTRLALAPAVAHFDVGEDGVVRDDRLETLAIVGTTLVHAVAVEDGPPRLADAQRIATGPEGSASHKLARVLAAQRTPAPAIVPLASNSAETAFAALTAGRADAAVLVRARENRTAPPALAGAPADLRHIDAADWWTGAARLELPFLRPARIDGEDGAAPVRTLAMQTTLAGPAPPAVSVLGRQGPSSYSAALFPMPDAVVLAIDDALGPHPDVGPHLRRAAALDPQLGSVPTVVNPSPDHAVLLVAIFGFLAFAGWLLVRPAPGRER